MTHAHDIEADAATWLTRRDAGLRAAEEKDFASWIAADPRHRAAYLRLAQAWERAERLKRLAPEGGVVDPDLLAPGRSSFRSTEQEQSEGRSRGWIYLGSYGGRTTITAGIAVLSLAAIVWSAGRPGSTTYTTGIGGLSRIVLTDGSAVTLNTDTELRVRFTNEKRGVQLVRGEAQFQVAHDMHHPFEVEAAGRIVRAVGTAFDVRLSSPESVEVVVTEGKVAVVAGGDPDGANGTEVPTISAGESAVATPRQVMVRPIAATEASRRLAWEQGELSFQGETLGEAVEEFNRYNRKKLRVEDPAISKLEVGGNFQALDVDSFIAALDRSFGIVAKNSDDGTVLLERAGSQRE